MEARGSGLTDRGRAREVNEDAFLVDDDLGLYLVCDGLGGHAAGETAARIAVETVAAHVDEQLGVVSAVRKGRGDHEELLQTARVAAAEACRRVHELATTRSELSGMGCTLTMLLVAGDKAAMAHVGDTRLYLHRDGASLQLTTDHTMAADHVRSGRLTAEQAATSRYANVLTRAIGSQASVQAETLILDVLPDDVFLLCSDGLSHYLEGLGELASYLGDDRLEHVPKALVDLANTRGGKDNITTVVVEITASDDEQERALELGAEVRAGIAALREVEIFRDLRFADILRLFHIAEVRSCKAGSTVFQVGDPCPGLCVPLSGRFDAEGPDREVRVVRPGRSLGETALLLDRPCRATLTTGTSGELLLLDGARFRELAQRRPWLGADLMGRIAEVLGNELASTWDDLDDEVVSETRRGRWNPLRWF